MKVSKFKESLLKNLTQPEKIRFQTLCIHRGYTHKGAYNFIIGERKIDPKRSIFGWLELWN